MILECVISFKKATSKSYWPRAGRRLEIYVPKGESMVVGNLSPRYLNFVDAGADLNSSCSYIEVSLIITTPTSTPPNILRLRQR